MNTNAIAKIIAGWVLVAVGLALIGQTINLSYRDFTSQADFPQVFKTLTPNPASETKTPVLANQNQQELAQAQIQQSMDQALGNVLPADSVTKLLNMIAWSIFATLLIYAGGRITSLGIQFLSAKNS